MVKGRKHRARSRRPWRHIRRGKPKIPLAVVGGLAASVLNARHPGSSYTVGQALMKGDIASIVNNAAPTFFGVMPDGSVNWGHLLGVWTPTIVGIGVHMTVGRAVNKYLKRVPYVNI